MPTIKPVENCFIRERQDVKDLLEQICQGVNFAEFHLKCFQSIRKWSHMTIESYMYDYNKIIFVVKKNHFEYPYPALF